MPGGVPIGEARRRSDTAIRGMTGGEEAALDMLERLTRGRGGQDITPPGHAEKLVELPDGSRIGYRKSSRSGGPAIDINIIGLNSVKRLHY